MRLIEGETVHRLCAWQPLAEALLAGHRGGDVMAGRAMLESETGGNMDYFMAIPAWIPGQVMGAKLTSVFPGNPDTRPGFPAVQALFTLFDGTTGAPLAVLDGTALTYRKTAADSALGAWLVAAKEMKTMVMVGAGGLAPYLIDAHRALNPTIEEILIWNRTGSRAQELAARLREKGLNARHEPELEDAVRRADLISCATNATAPLVKGAWLKAGCHLDLVGAYRAEMRESDDAAVSLARLFVDSRQFALEKTGELGQPLENGLITRKEIEADLFDMARPDFRFERQADDITLFKNGGGAHLDLFTAQFIWQQLANEPQ